MITAFHVLAALKQDSGTRSGICRGRFGYPAQPREVWLEDFRLWVREDGYVTGWPGGHYIAKRFHGLGGWLIRRAFNRKAASYGA